jgi:hypothetical protein
MNQQLSLRPAAILDRGHAGLVHDACLGTVHTQHVALYIEAALCKIVQTLVAASLAASGFA